MTLLDLKLADLESRAPDYPDRAQGINAETVALRDLASLGDQLPPEQRLLLQARFAQHVRSFSDFPTTHAELDFTPSGIRCRSYPDLSPQSPSHEVPRMTMRPPDGWTLVAPD